MNKKFTREDFIKKAREVHGDKYDYSKVDYFDSRHDVVIICRKHGEFIQRANRHLQGCGCKKCSSEKRAVDSSLNTDEWVKMAKKVHGNKYDYSKVEYKNSYTKVCIVCPIHGEFWILPYAHVNLGEGCAKCANTEKLSKETFIEKAKKVHGDKYDYSKVEYINSRTKVCIICPIHGEFWQRPSSHLEGYGCKKCSTTKNSIKQSSTKDDFIEKARKVHGDRYDYSKVEYRNNYTKVCIICPEHGEFWQTPNGHLYNLQGCPNCKKSRMECYTKLLLERNGINYETEKTFDWLIYENNMKLDFLCGKIAIECQGGQHFVTVKKYGGDEGLVTRLERDKLKYEKCKEHNIPIIYIIPYRYRNSKVFNDFYKDKNYIFFKDIDDKLVDRLREVL